MNHNLKGYDEHLILKHVKNRFADDQIEVIANNIEQYLGFRIKSFKFIDSYQFLKSSLEGLVKMLPNEKLRHTKKHFARPELIARKGVYPYEYMTDVNKFLETELPAIEKFYSTLTKEGISQDDYEHAKNV